MCSNGYVTIQIPFQVKKINIR